MPGYWLAQVLGALSAALVLRALFGLEDDLGATLPKFGVFNALVMEVFLTCLLVTVILGTATQHKVVGSNAALASGGTVALCALFARPVSGASMNPARSLGPALVSGLTDHYWVYLVGPLIGAGLATLFMLVLYPERDGSEVEAASSKGGD